MIVYLLKFVCCSSLFLLVYYLLLEKEKINRFNRFYLLSVIVLSFLIPIIHAHQLPDESGVRYTTKLIEASILNQTAFQTTDTTVPEMPNVETCIWVCYLFISIILLFRFLKNLFRLYLTVINNPVIDHHHAKLVLTKETILPYSFLNYVFVNRDDFKGNAIENEILTHELAHVSQKHSIDILLIELMLVIAWINPLLFFYRRAIRLNHEFLADEAVTRIFDLRLYRSLLFKKVYLKSTISLSSSFNYSLTKKRLLMMTKKTPRLRALLKQFALIPVFAFAFYACGDESKSLSEKSLDLISPNGERITNSIEQLYKWSSEIALDKLGTTEFEITGIEYMDVKEGYVAQINLEANNVKTHYLLMRIPQTDPVSGRVSQAGCDGTWQVSCSGTTCCTPNFNLNTGSASCICSDGGNSGCTLGVRCIEQQQ